MKTLVIITKIPSPYRVHLFKQLSKELEKKEMHLIVKYFMSSDPRRPKSWFEKSSNIGYDYEFYNAYTLSILNKKIIFNPSLILSIIKSKPNYLIVGGPWASLTNIIISLFLLKKQQTKICWYELNYERFQSFSILSKKIKKWLVKKYDIIAIPGEDAKKASSALLESSKIKFLKLPNIVNEEMFICEDRGKIAQQIRKRLNINLNIKIAILPARLSKEKGVLNLIDVIGNMSFDNWFLLIIGDGPLENEVKSKIEHYNLSSKVILIKSVDYAEMPLFYNAADLFILPSFWDHNPLTVVEAMWSRLPILISDRIGNLNEALNYKGTNGWSFNPYDNVGMTRVISKALNHDTKKLKEMGNESYIRVKQFWSTETIVKEFVHGIELS